MTLIPPKENDSNREPTHKERMMHQSWCLKNDILIWFEPIDWRQGRIVVSNRGVESESAEIYKQTKLRKKDPNYHEEIYKLYTKFYKQNNENNDRDDSV